MSQGNSSVKKSKGSTIIKAMKTLLILLLTVVLAAGAFLSRPSEESFREFVAAPTEKTHDTPIGTVTIKMDPTSVGEEFTYKDRFLWSTVEKDGQTAYVGVFGNWFKA